MREIVIDASVAATWFLRDEESALGDWVQRRAKAGMIVAVPSIWLLEVSNLLATAARRSRIDKSGYDDALITIQTLPLRLLPPPSITDVPELNEIMRNHRLTSYDAEYLRVCRLHQLPLASLDRVLVTAGRRENVTIVQPS